MFYVNISFYLRALFRVDYEFLKSEKNSELNYLDILCNCSTLMLIRFVSLNANTVKYLVRVSLLESIDSIISLISMPDALPEAMKSMSPKVSPF